MIVQEETSGCPAQAIVNEFVRLLTAIGGDWRAAPDEDEHYVYAIAL